MTPDKHQQEAIDIDHPQVCCVAGPGAGKSTVICLRMKRMCKEVDPFTIACITFTRYAAQSIKDKLGERGPWVGTFHAWCLSIIQRWGESLGYNLDTLTILDDEEVSMDEKEVLLELTLCKKAPDGKITWSRVRKKDWDNFKACTFGGLDGSCGDATKDLLMERALNAFLKRMRAQNTMTFSTLMLEADRLLEDHEIREQVQACHSHILFDEFQDTDHQQWGISCKLIDQVQPMSLFVVGDPDQSIYEWRKASPSIFLGIADESAEVLGWKRVDLVNCYRYGPGIGKPSQALIHNNSQRLDHEIEFKGADPGLCQHMDKATLDTTSRLVHTLLDYYNPQDIAVLCRSHVPLQCTERVFKAMDIPAVKLGQISDLKRTHEFRACVSLLRLGINPADRTSFMACTAMWGLKTSQIVEARERALRDGCNLVDAALFNTPLPKDLAGMKNHIALNRSDMEPFQHSFNYLDKLQHMEGFADTKELVNYLAMGAVQDEAKSVGDRVTLCTVHAAKGLEWPVVIIIGCNHGLFPTTKGMTGNLEEERRLFYVAMTRAKERLFLVNNDFSDQSDHVEHWQAMLKSSSPSMFIDEALTD